ncbi:MAG: Imm52 family immunity protein [Micromonosporaceae bacterium]
MSPQNPSWPGATDLSKDVWVFEGQWDARPDDLSRCAERLLACLDGMSPVDPSLAHWIHDTERVKLDLDSLRELLERGRDELDPTGESGSTVGMGNADDLAAAALTVTCGATASYMKNGITLELPRPAAAPQLYADQPMVELFRTMVSAWRPQWCRVDSWSLRDAVGTESAGVLGSWIAYLERSLYTRVGELPGDVRVVPVGDGDVFVLAATPDELRLETIDAVRTAIDLPDALR